MIRKFLALAVAASLLGVPAQAADWLGQGATKTSGYKLDITLTGDTAVTFPTSGTLGGGSVTSVGLTVPGASIFGVTGSPVTTSGSLGITTTGTSGGIPYFNSTSTLSSSGAFTSNRVILGGGSGNPPKGLAGFTTDGTSKLTLGVAGTSTGTLELTGSTSGSATFVAAAAAGSPTITAPAESGTLLTSSCAGPGFGYLGTLAAANFNSTADQAITLCYRGSGFRASFGNSVASGNGMRVKNCSGTPTLAAGTVYSAAGKTGTLFGATGDTYTGATSATKVVVNNASANALANFLTATTVYLSLTTANGSALTCDVYIYGEVYP